MALALFAFITGLILNLWTEVRYSAIWMGGSVVYYIINLGFQFDEFPISFSALIIICWAFFIVNQVFLKMSEEKDKFLNKKWSTLNLSMCKLLDYLPYSVLIEHQNKILIFNKKLLELLEIDENEGNIKEMVKYKLKEFVVEIGKDLECKIFILVDIWV